MEREKKKRKTHWYDWLWVALVFSLLLPLYDLRFVWLSLVFMAAPILITLFTNGKTYCNKYCGRGQLYQVIGEKCGASRDRKPPRFLRARWFRWTFVAMFAVKFVTMIHGSLNALDAMEKLQWMMLMTTAMGLAAMFLFKPRTWCVACPMGTVTQEMCRVRNRRDSDMLTPEE